MCVYTVYTVYSMYTVYSVYMYTESQCKMYFLSWITLKRVKVTVVEKSNKDPITVTLLKFGVQGWDSCCSVVS